MRLRPIIATVVLAVGLTGTVAACGGGEDGIPTPSDPVLAEGQKVYRSSCAQCHGTKGGGGQGPKLAGVVEARYELDEHIRIITEGKGGGMPAYAKRLTPEQIEAVARYEREVL